MQELFTICMVQTDSTAIPCQKSKKIFLIHLFTYVLFLIKIFYVCLHLLGFVEMQQIIITEIWGGRKLEQQSYFHQPYSHTCSFYETRYQDWR